MREILIQQLDKRKVCSVWVKLVNGHCLDYLMKFWVTEDETWQLFNPIFTKQENMAWLGKHEKRPRIVRPKLTPNKVMIMLAFTGD